MPLDTSIAMGYRPPQIPNQLASYAQMQQIMAGQQAQELAKYQLGAAQRGEETQNVLARAYASSVDPSTGKIDYNKLTSLVASGGGGAQLPGIEKSRRESETADLTRQKTLSDLIDARLKQSRGYLDTIDPMSPEAPQQYIAWHEANHRDPIIGTALKERGITADQSRRDIEFAIQKGPEALAELINKSKLGTEKFMEMNKPVTSVAPTGIVQTPGLGGGNARVVPGTAAAFQMTPGQESANRNAEIRIGQTDTRIAQAEARAADAARIMEARLAQGDRRISIAEEKAAAGPPLKPVPVHAQKAIIGAATSIKKIDDAITLMENSKNATGYKGFLPDVALNRLYPETADARAAVADIGSLIIHERSGAAVTASETPRLMPFIPKVNDEPKIALTKLKRLRQIQADEAEALAGTYTSEQGFREFTPGKITPTAPSAPSGGLSPAEQAELEQLRKRFKK